VGVATPRSRLCGSCGGAAGHVGGRTPPCRFQAGTRARVAQVPTPGRSTVDPRPSVRHPVSPPPFPGFDYHPACQQLRVPPARDGGAVSLPRINFGAGAPRPPCGRVWAPSARRVPVARMAVPPHPVSPRWELRQRASGAVRRTPVRRSSFVPISNRRSCRWLTTGRPRDHVRRPSSTALSRSPSRHRRRLGDRPGGCPGRRSVPPQPALCGTPVRGPARTAVVTRGRGPANEARARRPIGGQRRAHLGHLRPDVPPGGSAASRPLVWPVQARAHFFLMHQRPRPTAVRGGPVQGSLSSAESTREGRPGGPPSALAPDDGL